MIPRTIDIYVFAFGILLTGAGIKLMSLLPDRYYFTFSQVIDSKNQSQFLTRPELPSVSSFCRSLFDTTTAEEIDPPKAVSDACDTLGRNASVEDVMMPSGASAGGVALHSQEYKDNVSALVKAIKSKFTELRDGINAAGGQYRKPIENLNDEEFESALFRDGTANLTNLALYAMGGGDEDTDTAYQSTEALRADPEIARLLDEQESLATADRDSLGEDEDRSRGAKLYWASVREKPTKTIESYLVKNDRLSFLPALLLKLVPALVTGLVMAAIFREKALDQAPLAAAFTAFLFCWPVIVLWDNVVSTEWMGYRVAFFALYVAYIVTYFFAARLGAMLMLRSPAVRVPDAVLQRIDLNKILATAATTLVTSGITAAITWTFTTSS